MCPHGVLGSTIALRGAGPALRVDLFLEASHRRLIGGAVRAERSSVFAQEMSAAIRARRTCSDGVRPWAGLDLLMARDRRKGGRRIFPLQHRST